MSVVITSISPPNAVMRELAQQCSQRGYSFYVVGDVPSPSNFELNGCEFFSIQRQKETGFQIAQLLPLRHYSRKNIGYLLAIRNRSTLLLETDDDNMPHPEFWRSRHANAKVRVTDVHGWCNVYSYFAEENIWPRGLPLDAVRTPLSSYDSLEEKPLVCPIQQGLADDNPDVDAIYRLVLPLPVRFRRDRKLALGVGNWCPFNSQNTVWFPEAFLLLYLPSYCSFRMTDIWRSFVAQRIAWENGWRILFTGPDVSQERNEHDLMKDFRDEIAGYTHNRRIAEELEKLSLAPGTENIPHNLMTCYESLVRLGVIGSEELQLVDAWCSDLAAARAYSHGAGA